ncbi:MAG: LysM peptidoglycan-binding domain-containing protein [Acetobacteraceae bacterium]|nr:LysM peptidoglycan-binding domain-containing protein [Acetobacteraceae bacterium]
MPVLIPLLLAGAGLVLAGVFAFRGLPPWTVPPLLESPEQRLETLAEHPAPAAKDKPPPVAEQVTPSFDIVRVNPKGEAVIAGRAAPGTEVTVRDAGQEIGKSRADTQGSWVVIPSGPLAPGARELTLSSRDPDGRETQGQGSVLLVVPERAGSRTSPASPPLAVLTGKGNAPKLLQSPFPSGQGPSASSTNRLGLEAAEYDEHGAVRFAGTAPAGAAVRLYVDNKPAGDAVADANGRWTLSPEAWVALGPHRLRIDQLTSSGDVAARTEVPFQREAQAPRDLGPGRVMVQRGQNLWQLARNVYGSGPRYTVIYEANREQIRDPRRIYPGQIFSVPPSASRPPSAPTRAGQSR